MGNQVIIRYTIGEDEWARSSAMRWQEDVFPTYYCFYGLVSFRVGDREVLGDGQFDMSVADLAVGLARIAGELRTATSGVHKFQQSDDMLEISFETSGDLVVVSHNLAPGQSWPCSRCALEAGIVDFVTSFANEAGEKIADLFSWKDMEGLQGFRVRT